MKRAALWTWLGLLLAAGPSSRGETFLRFHATQVVAYAPGPGNEGYPDPGLALGGPRGGGPYNGSDHVVTLGLRGSLTLGFADADGRGRIITDGPGADFIVFENPMVDRRSGLVFGELVRVQVSSDGVHFAEFPTWCGETYPIPPTGLEAAIFPELYRGFAGIAPVLANVDSNGPAGLRDPFDPADAGGDAFDLADLAGVPEVRGGLVDPGAIRWLRLVDVDGGGAELDSTGQPIYDPSGQTDRWPDDPNAVRPLSADIDAVSVIHGLYAWVPAPGDADEDGDVDCVDYLAVKRNIGAGPAASWPDGDFDRDGCVTRADFLLLREHFGQGVRDGGAAAGEPLPEPAAALLLAAGAAAMLPRRGRRRTNGR